MRNFQIGDTVICIDSEASFNLIEGEEYPVVDIWMAGYNDNNPRILINGKAEGYLAYRFKLKEESLPDLPATQYQFPVYGNEVDVLDVIDSKQYDQVLLIQERKRDGECVRATHLKLDPDEALDLAHDLTRMAMQIKRRTKD